MSHLFVCALLFVEAPIDMIMHGQLPDGELIGLKTIPGYIVRDIILRTLGGLMGGS